MAGSNDYPPSANRRDPPIGHHTFACREKKKSGGPQPATVGQATRRLGLPVFSATWAACRGAARSAEGGKPPPRLPKGFWPTGVQALRPPGSKWARIQPAWPTPRPGSDLCALPFGPACSAQGPFFASGGSRTPEHPKWRVPARFLLAAFSFFPAPEQETVFGRTAMACRESRSSVPFAEAVSSVRGFESCRPFIDGRQSSVGEAALKRPPKKAAGEKTAYCRTQPANPTGPAPKDIPLTAPHQRAPFFAANHIKRPVPRFSSQPPASHPEGPFSRGSIVAIVSHGRRRRARQREAVSSGRPRLAIVRLQRTGPRCGTIFVVCPGREVLDPSPTARGQV